MLELLAAEAAAVKITVITRLAIRPATRSPTVVEYLNKFMT